MANTTSYMLKFGADATSVTKAITGVNSDIRSMSTQAKNLDTAFRLTGDTSALKGKLQALGNQLSATEAKGKLLKEELANLKSSPGFDANSAKAQKLTNDIAKTESEVVKLKAQLANAKTSSFGEGLSGGMDNANNSLSVGKIALGGFLGNLATGAVSAFASVVGKAFEGVGQDIISASDGIQKFQSTMSFGGKSAAEINKVTTASKKYADDTVYDLTTVLNTTAQLGANGVKNYQKLVEASGNLNAVAGGNADTFNSVAMVLTQTAGAGKLTTENWNQLADAIPGASGKLQEALKDAGAYTGNFRDAMADGQITADEFNKAIMQLGMTDAAKEAATSTSTFEGAFGNLQASFVTAGTSFLDNFKQPITDGMTALANVVPNISAAISGALSGLGSALSGMFSGFNVQDAMYVFSQISGSIMEMVDDVRSIDFSNLTSAFSNLDIQLPDFSPLMNLASSIVPMLGNAFSSLKFDGLVDLANQIIPALSAGFKSFLGWVVPAIQPLLGAFSNLWNAIQPVLSIVAGSLVPIFKVLGSFLGGFVSGVMSTLTFAFNALAVGIKLLTPVIGSIGQAFNALSPIISFIAGILGTVMGASVNVLGKIFSTVGQAISSVWSRLSGVFSSVAGIMSGIFSSIGSLFSALGSIFSSIGSRIGSTGRAIASIFSSVGVRLGGIFSGISSAFSAVGGVIAGVGGRIGGIVSNIIGFFSGIGGRILRGFGNIGSSIANLFSGVIGRIGSMFSGVAYIGRNIVEGIKLGIIGAIGGLVSTAANMARQALNAAKHALGIHSPSRVFRDEVGKYITQGIGVGMEKETGYLSKASDSVKNSLLSDWQNVNLNSNLTNGINSSSHGVSTGTSGTNNVFNITANTKADASAIASEVKVILRQNGIGAR